MGPKDTSQRAADLFLQPLIELLNPRHELVRLAAAMDWTSIERTFSAHFASRTGRPALPPRLVAGLLHRQHACDRSDEVAVSTWVENRSGNLGSWRRSSRHQFLGIQAS